MDIAQVLRAYDTEIRARPVVRPGRTVEDDGRIVTSVSGFNFVSWWRLTSADVSEAVAAHAARFRTAGQSLIWRVYDHDGPPELSACLAENGFRPGPPGALMFLDLAEPPADEPPAADIRRAVTPAGVADFLAVSDRVFGTDEAERRQGIFVSRLEDPGFALYVAYVDERPVASAHLETAPGQPFGALFGGGVDPEHRGRGLYRALVNARADEARRRGARYLSIEAGDMSRPILERLGFVSAVQEVTWVLPKL